MSDQRPATDSSLPNEEDFAPYGGLDEQCAWKHFGGLALDEANKKFRESPDIYQEDFMFMSPKAFAHYFPVIDSYLRQIANCDEDGDRQAWILACGIQLQLKGSLPPDVFPRILDLATFVRENIGLFSADAREQRRIDAAWHQIQAHITDGEAIDDSQVPTEPELEAMMRLSEHALQDLKSQLDQNQLETLNQFLALWPHSDDETKP